MALKNTLLAVIFGLLLFPHVLFIENVVAAGDAVEQGRKALQGRVRYPWYDAEKDEARLLRVAPHTPADNAHRKSDWETVPTTTTNWSWWWPLAGLGITSSLLNIIGLLVLLALIGGLIYWLIVAAFGKDDVRLEFKSQVQFAEPVQRKLRVEELTVPIPTTVDDFIAEIRRLVAAGNLTQAMIYLFSYQLLQLDLHQHIRLSRGKTNRQYLRELRSRPDLQSLLERSMVAFEDVFFGRHELPRERFDACYRALDEFHRKVEVATL